MGSCKDPRPARPCDAAVLVVDSRPLVGTLMAQEIDASASFRLVAHATDLAQAREILADSECDVLLFGAGGVGMGAAEFVSAVHESSPGIALVVLVLREGDEESYEAIAAGASCSVTLDTPDLELFRRLRAARDGQVLLPAGFVKKLTSAAEPLLRRKRSGVLTDTESDVLTMSKRGLSQADIAGRLGLSNVAVKSHLIALYGKVCANGGPEDAWMTA